MLKLSLFLSFWIATFSLFAQSTSEPNGYCGTTELSPEQREFLQNFQSQPKVFMAQQSEAILYVPIKVHSVGQDNGQGHLDKTDISRIICELNDWYDPVGFHFYLFGDVNHINNSDYYNHTGSLTGRAMMIQNNVSGVLNMYLVNDPAGNCGYFSPMGDGIALRKSCTGSGNTTVAHEIGHYMSLPHTFHGWEGGTPPVNDQELVDGSNCSNAGDGFCDTPPDYLSDRWTCPYSGSVLKDPKGDTVIPDGSYIMSYANDACTYQFSPQQRFAMKGFLVTNRNSHIQHDLPSFQVDGPSELVFPSDSIGGIVPDNTTFTWSAVEGATHYHLRISRISILVSNTIDIIIEDTSFTVSNLLANKKYYWGVEAIANGDLCSDNNSSIQSFNTGWPTGIEDHDELTNFSIYPNPASKGQSLSIDFGQRMTGGVLRVGNLQGQTLSMKAIDGEVLQVPTANLPSGMYLIQVETEQGIRTERIVLH